MVDTQAGGVLVKSVNPNPVYQQGFQLSGIGALADISAQTLFGDHRPTGLYPPSWDTFEQPGPYAVPLKVLSQGSLGTREQIPGCIEGLSATASSGYCSNNASSPAISYMFARRSGLLEDAEAWSSVLHTHSAGLPPAFLSTQDKLQEHVWTQDLKAMVKDALLFAFIYPANSREGPDTASADPSAKVLSATRRKLAELARDYEQLDRERQLRQLEETATIQARLRAPRALLDDLAMTRGLSWHTIAGMIAVTPTAIRKWRRGGSLTPDNRQQLALLVAFFDLLEQVDYPPQDVGSWVEMAVHEDTTLTPAEIYCDPAGRWLLLEWVRGNLDTTSMLDRNDPDWRSRYAPDSAFRVGVGPDGEPAIVPR